MDSEYSYTWSNPQGTLAICYSMEELLKAIKETGFIKPDQEKLKQSLSYPTEHSYAYTYGVVFKITKQNLNHVIQ